MPLDPSAIESRTQSLGRELLGQMRRLRPRALSVKGLEERAMGLLMRDPDLRAQVLRFIDVFPVLESPREIREHLGAHLGAVRRARPGAPRATGLIRLLGRLAARGRIPARVASSLSHWSVRHMAERFIVESDAVERLRVLERRGFLFTLDVLGEAVHSDAEADAFARQYTALAETLGERLGSCDSHAGSPAPLPRRALCGPRVNLSVKLSALTAHFDPAAPERTSHEVRTRLRPLFRAARAAGAFVNVDAEQFEVRDLTWRVLRETLEEEEFADWEDVGLAVQAYLRDAPEHLEAILDWLRRRWGPTASGCARRLTIRLVKGAYWDAEQIWARQRRWPIPVLLDKAATDAQCEAMVQTLLEHRALVRTALGSHNARTVARTLALAEALGTPVGDLEFQVLHGMGETLAQALLAMGQPVRVYVPWGPLIPGMAYLVRRLLENTSNTSFLRQFDTSRGAEAALLADPAAQRAEGSAAAALRSDEVMGQRVAP